MTATTSTINTTFRPNAEAIRRPVAVDADGNAVQCFYDLPGFVGDGFWAAANAVDFWVGQCNIDRREDDERYAVDGPTDSEVRMLSDLHLYRPTWNQTLADDVAVSALIREVLEQAMAEVHGLAETDRGHYLAQLLTRWFSDGRIDWLRFRIGHLLATYFEMMPTVGQALGLLSTAVDTIVFGWETPHGLVLDVVHLFHQESRFVDADTAEALDLGNEHHGDFAGVRYLPLDDLSDARWYTPDGSWSSVAERDLLAAFIELA